MFLGYRGSEMAHNHETQTTSDDMPSVPYTIRRNGVFYFNFRYPTQLVKAGLTRSHAKKSLKTTCWKKAKELAVREAAFHQAEADRLLKQLEATTDQKEKVERERIPLSTLTKREQRDLVLKKFVDLEQRAERARAAFHRERDPVEIESILDTVRTDLAAYEGCDQFRPLDWEEEFRGFAKRAGFTCEGEEVEPETVNLYRRAVVEVQWRTVEAYEGREFERRDPAFKELHSLAEVASPAVGRASGHTVHELCERYPKRKQEGKLSPATIASYALPIRILQECFGLSADLASLGFRDGEKLVRFLASVPKNAAKRYPAKSLKDAARAEGEQAEPLVLSPKRQKDVFQTIKAMMTYAKEVGWVRENPFASTALLDTLPTITKRNREQFTGEDLGQLFSSKQFMEWRGKTDKEGNRTEGRFWVPLIAMFHGVRINEAASLLLTDVKTEGGVEIFSISETDDAGEKKKRLKTSSSARRVPIHAELIKMGFLEFVEAQRASKPDGFLFPELTPNKQTGNRAKVLSQWFGRLRTVVLEEKGSAYGKDLHSLRHSVTDCLRRAEGTSDEMRYALLGWSSDAEKKNAGFDYGSGFSLSDLKKLVDQIDYPGFDPSILYT